MPCLYEELSGPVLELFLEMQGPLVLGLVKKFQKLKPINFGAKSSL